MNGLIQAAADPLDQKVLLVFVDGIGVGNPDPATNPLLRKDLEVLSVMRLLEELGEVAVTRFAARVLDATLGVPGLPQSATGQATLLTGVNAAALLGRHLSGIPNAALRRLLARESLFLKLARLGVAGDFINAFSPEFFQFLKRRRLSTTTWAALAGGRWLRTFADLAAGRALYQDFTNLFLQNRGYDYPLCRPETAGATLAALAGRQPFLMYEYFLTDFAGHGRDPEFAGVVVRLLDKFLESLLQRVDLERVTVLLSSDHGNLENLSTKSHTTNPVPLLAWGPRAGDIVGRCRSLADITPAILAMYQE